MTHFHRRHKHLISKIAHLGIVAFFLTLALASVDTVWALYIKSFVNNDALVGLVAAAFTLLSFLLFFIIIPSLEKHSKYKILLHSLIVMFICLVLYSIITKFWMFVLVSIVLVTSVAFRRSAFGILIRDESKLKDIGKNESLIYTIFNSAWVIGPLIAGFFLTKYGVNIIFLVASVFIIIAALLLFKVKIREAKHKGAIDTNILKNFFDYMSDKNKVKAYLISAGIAVWWSIVYIYLPLMIIREGLGAQWIGYSLFAIPIPLILLEIYAGKSADKQGFRGYLIFGFLVLSIAALAIFFVDSVFLIIGLFVLASFGAAFIEPLRDGYFFKITPKSKADKYYPPFLTSSNIGGTVGKLIAAGVIFFIGFKFIFLFLFFEMLFFVYIAFTIKEK